MCAKCSDEEVYEIAERMLLDKKMLVNFEPLDDDDKARIMVIVNRGVNALSEYEAKRMKLGGKRPHIPSRAGRLQADSAEFSHSNKRKKQELIPLANKFDIAILPLKIFTQENPVLLRKVMEALIRRLSPRDIGILFIHFPEHDVKILLQESGPQQIEDIRHFMNTPVNEISPLDLEVIGARYSLTLATSLIEEEHASISLKSFLKNYLETLQEHVQDYCQTLAVKLNILRTLESLSPQGWNRLVGLTPRKTLALVADAIPEKYWNKLIESLPKTQREDVLHLRKLESQARKNNLHAYVNMMDALKGWIPIINKITIN